MGEGHTSHERPAGGKRKRTGRGQKEGEEDAFERCFQLPDKSLFALWKRQGEEKQKRERRRGRKNLPCLLSDLEAEGMRLKALGLQKKILSISKIIIKGLATDGETRGLWAEVSLLS